MILRRPRATRPRFSIIVAVYDMAREIERTLESLSRQYQLDVEDIVYEVIVVDNGSPDRLDADRIEGHHGARYLYVDNGSASPVEAINTAVLQAEGEIIAVMIDGARMLSPGVIEWAARAFGAFEDPVVSVLGYHLGPDLQPITSLAGYDQQVEDQLLDETGWRDDGYRLFEISCLAGSSKFGEIRIAESNCLFMSRERYDRLGGFDERFQSPGGGLCNLDLFRRAVTEPGVEVVKLVGEGCFHQYHGGVATGGTSKFESFQSEYTAIRGERFVAPSYRSLVLGESRTVALPHVRTGSASYLDQHGAREEGRDRARALMAERLAATRSGAD